MNRPAHPSADPSRRNDSRSVPIANENRLVLPDRFGTRSRAAAPPGWGMIAHRGAPLLMMPALSEWPGLRARSNARLAALCGWSSITCALRAT